MELENQGLEQDVSAESSPAAEPSESKSVKSESVSEEQSTPKQEKYVPYDRFQEIIKEKNEFSKRFEESEKQMAALRQQFEESRKQSSEASKPKNPLIERLKGIDNEFGGFLEQQMSANEALKAELQALKEQSQQMERVRLQSQVQDTMAKLKAEYKLDDAKHRRYEQIIRAESLDNPKLGLQDLPTLYKAIHEMFNPAMESVKKSAIAEYTKEKKADASLPKAGKGATPKQETSKPKYSQDREERLHQMVQRALSIKRTEE